MLQYIEIRQLGKVITGKTPPTEEENNFGGDIPFITPSDIKGFEDLAGKQVAVKNGTMSDQYATELADQYGFTVVRVDDDDMMYQQVAGGQAAACFNDTVVLQQNIKKGVALKIVEGTANEGAQYGFAVFDAKNQELIDLFNAGLANVKASGKYDEILAKYLG